MATLPLSALVLSACTLCASLSASTPASSTMHVFVGTFTPSGNAEGIFAADFDPATGGLSGARRVAQWEDPSFLALAADGKTLYSTGVKDGKGFLSAYAIDTANGALTLVNRQPNGSNSDCHVAVSPDGSTLLAANYNEGFVSAFPLQASGQIGPRSFFRKHEGTGPNHQRQEGPHAHAFTPDTSGRFAFAPDLGADRLFAYRFGKKAGELEAVPTLDITSPAGHGPRHMTFAQDGFHAYEFDELSGTVRAYVYQPSAGKLTFLQEVSALPQDYHGPAGGAEIILHPNGRFLYASNRENHQSVAVFSVDLASGKLALVQHFQANLVHPRYITFDPSGKWLLVTNTFGGSIVVAPVNPETGLIGVVVSKLEVPGPSAIVFVAKTP